MAPPSGYRLNYKRALWTFALAYIAITIVATAFSIAIELSMHVPPNTAALADPAYLLAERFLPILNLMVWTIFAWLYFRNQPTLTKSLSSLRGESLALGALWLIAAIVVDYVCFVRIKNPISLSPHDFYIGQFPWIYLIYLAVLFSPLCYVTLATRTRSIPAVSR
jgi:hypothetical protein